MAALEGAEYITRQAREAGCKLIALWFTDVAGRLKSVAVTAEQLESAVTDGVIFDGGTIVGRARHEETDVLLMPDPETFAVLPWRSRDDSPVARMFCDLVRTDGGPFDHDSRGVLKRTLGDARELGYTVYVGAEVEYYYFKDERLPPTPVDSATYFDSTPSNDTIQLRRDTIFALEQLGVAVDATHHEVGPGQYEIRLQYADALAMADAVMTTRTVVKRLAQLHGVVASFMPKPLADQEGSGLHLTLGLTEDGRDAFHDPADAQGLSPTARGFLAGMLARAAESCIVGGQWVNSYKRLVAGTEAPTACTWARTNWCDLVRVPSMAGRDGLGFEYRGPDSACNPYLTTAVVLAAGLQGIRSGATPPPLRQPDAPPAADAEHLPTSLAEAVTKAEGSQFLERALGSRLAQTLVGNARAEWDAYHREVGAWELRRYLTSL